MQFNDLINNMLSEKFGTHTNSARKRSAVGNHMTSSNPNLWKDPLNRHSMKGSRPSNRKDPGFVPRTHQRELSVPLAQKSLDIAKSADEGIWRISKLQALALGAKYRFHIPDDRSPIKHLGSTGIVLWRKTEGVDEPELYLVKHDSVTRSGLAAKKQQQRIQGNSKGSSVFKGSWRTKHKAKKPRKPKGPMFMSGKVGT